MELTEKFVSREEIFNGSVLHLVKDEIELPNGEHSHREICLHIGGVCVIPVTDDGMVVMERQYRYAHGRVYLEIPAGKLNYPDEDPLSAAKRELLEETGATAERITYLGQVDTTPALMNEKIQMFMAEGLTFGERQLDDDEFLDVELIPLAELTDMVMSGEIRDSKTQIAILKAARIKGIM